MEAICLQPMDTIKTRLQLQGPDGRYRGIVHAGRTIAAEEGARSLWKGLTPFATHLTLKYYLRMGTNAVYQNVLRDENGHLTTSRRLAAGFAAGVTEALVIVTPFEVVKIRLQQQKGQTNLRYKGPIGCAAAIVREEGLRAMWSGAGPTVLRNGTNQMCLFWGKNKADGIFWNKHEGDGKRLEWWQSMMSGFAAAFVGPVATGPFDVAKTRLMAQGGAVEAGQAPKYRGFLHCLVTIPREEGIRALWRGLLPRLLRIPPGQAIVWTVSDTVVNYFG